MVQNSIIQQEITRSQEKQYNGQTYAVQPNQNITGRGELSHLTHELFIRSRNYQNHFTAVDIGSLRVIYDLQFYIQSTYAKFSFNRKLKNSASTIFVTRFQRTQILLYNSMLFTDFLCTQCIKLNFNSVKKRMALLNTYSSKIYDLYTTMYQVFCVTQLIKLFIFYRSLLVH